MQCLLDYTIVFTGLLCRVYQIILQYLQDYYVVFTRENYSVYRIISQCLLDYAIVSTSLLQCLLNYYVVFTIGYILQYLADYYVVFTIDYAIVFRGLLCSVYQIILVFTGLLQSGASERLYKWGGAYQRLLNDILRGVRAACPPQKSFKTCI